MVRFSASSCPEPSQFLSFVEERKLLLQNHVNAGVNTTAPAPSGLCGFIGAMQTPEAGADSSSTVPLQNSVSVAPAVSVQQGASQVPVQQQAQTVQQVQHVYQAQVQYVQEENNGVYTNGTIRSYSYPEPQLYSQNSSGSFFDTQGSHTPVSTVVNTHSLNNNNNGTGSGNGNGSGNANGAMALSAGQIINSSGAYLINMDASATHTSAAQSTRASPATISNSCVVLVVFGVLGRAIRLCFCCSLSLLPSFDFILPSLLLFFCFSLVLSPVSLRSLLAQIEMAIETLQKSEGLSSQRSSLLNSHLQWLLDNYETAEGVSLPRSTLYNHYLRHCQEQKLDPVNAASFGKLIRSIFMGLRTRRLGTRGNSKYHYYGIRVKPDSPLNRLQEELQYMALRQQPVQQKQRFKPVQKMDGVSSDGFSSGGQQQTGSAAEQSFIAQSQHHQQFLDGSRALPEFMDLDLVETVDGVIPEDVKALQTLYREHCEAILDVVVNLQFNLIENLWQTFWRYSSSNSVEGITITENSEMEARLPRATLTQLCRSDAVVRWMNSCDQLMYQALVEILIPDVLRPIPSALTQAIRNFAKSLEGWLTNAMSSAPQRMIQTKVSAVSAFAQTLRRYTSLNHLAQAARAVLQNTSQINQMLSDLNRVDFANVQEQASWVCQCEEGVVQRLEQDFKATLQQQSSLEQWAAWLENVVTQILKPYEDKPSLPKAARQFLLKWSFYSSMVIRDLTLRSAASFGSFHLIRLLYDEYMFYLVEHRVAQATGETAIGVMGEAVLEWCGAFHLQHMLHDIIPSPYGPLIAAVHELTVRTSECIVANVSSPLLFQFQDLNTMSPVNMDKDEVSDLDSDLEDDLEDPEEPLAKREKPEPEAESEVIQVLQVGTLEDGRSTVVGINMIQNPPPHTLNVLHPPPSAEHMLPTGATSTIRHCSSLGNSYASV
ncbi:hypothetical protein DNTS_032308 [Danionella cerebrum]|uniref:Transcription factor RFX3 n=1 Tax=Danionella cerebrum TaxID=2873325 RepID=A0A553PRA2_9TELE|nr:hypothetical protein DNTS_032308 [Danionella translucida]